ncbi:MAG TPA: type II toxin-antitoxin system HipA family toxin, partial [Nitratifractor sp.]|nr:type II toxin-antitoxin system HipA family toxin [Nitratifractor sp.]
NEYFCMKLAKSIGLNVASVELRYFSKYPALLVKRFDRLAEKNEVKRVHIIDACQMLNLSPSYKYEQNFVSNRDVKNMRDGVSFKKLFDASNRCDIPAIAKKELLNWAIFNLLIGNSDAHGKNFSFYVDKQGLKPAPFYDLVSVLAFNVEHSMAMAYGDEFDPDAILAYDLREFAQTIGINYKLVAQILQMQAKNIIQAITEEKVPVDTNSKESKESFDTLKETILKRATSYIEVAKQMGKVSY